MIFILFFYSHFIMGLKEAFDKPPNKQQFINRLIESKILKDIDLINEIAVEFSSGNKNVDITGKTLKKKIKLRHN